MKKMDAQAVLQAMLSRCSKQCTYATYATQLTNASKTFREILAFLTVRVGLWITRISIVVGAP